MEHFSKEIYGGLPDVGGLEIACFRLVVAALLGAVVGFQRQRVGKPAGLRTHMLVCIGAALVIVACMESGMSQSDLSRVIQGLVTGIGFVGAGAILKLETDHQIMGLTSAAGIWMTAAIGLTVGLGHWGTAALGAFITYIVLAVVEQFEPHIPKRPDSDS